MEREKKRECANKEKAKKEVFDDKSFSGTKEDSTSGYQLTLRLSTSPDKKTVATLRKIIAECKLIKSAEVDFGSLEEFLKPEVIEAEAVAA
jgi:hypothetical protein